MKTIIRNVKIINEGTIKESDLLFSEEGILEIGRGIKLQDPAACAEINGEAYHLFPGLIDDQVHFRDPGFPLKGTIYSESRAAAAGGITSYMDMPNTLPNTLTLALLEEKYRIAQKNSVVNYSFFMGINQANLEEALRVDNEWVCGITDDGLYFSDDKGILANYPDYLEKVFNRSNTLIALHSEDDTVIADNFAKAQLKYGKEIPIKAHAEIRSDLACYKATERVVELSRKYQNRLHIYHLSSGMEVPLFDNELNLRDKRITTEACVHHLFFNNLDYDRLGSKIKWNPSVKSEADRKALIEGLKSNRIDLIATDHAPHTLEQKERNYLKAMSGGPLVQHALPALLELYHKGEISLELIADKFAHSPSLAYRMIKRGFIREGYHADVVLVDLSHSQPERINNRYKCGWSPFDDYSFKSKVVQTWVNGRLVYQNDQIVNENAGKRLQFEKER